MFSFGGRRYSYCFGFCDMFLFCLRSEEHARISCTSAQFGFAGLWCSSVIKPESQRRPSSTSSFNIHSRHRKFSERRRIRHPAHKENLKCCVNYLNVCGRCFYSKLSHCIQGIYFLSMCSLGIEPTVFVLLAQWVIV